MTVFRPDQILSVLARGPQTYRMIAAAFGGVVSEKPTGWWRRFWWAQDVAGRQLARSLGSMLDDMVAVGQIVHAKGPPETWALPPVRSAGPA